MKFFRKAAWLCGGVVALVPQVTIGNTSQARLVIGATVVAPCRVGTLTGGQLSCASDSQGASFSTREGSMINPPTARTNSEELSVKFVEVSF